MRNLQIPLEDILELISCASDYGFEDDVLFDAFSDMIDKILTDKEIDKYSKSVADSEGYSEEDYEEIKKRLIEFRKKYCES